MYVYLADCTIPTVRFGGAGHGVGLGLLVPIKQALSLSLNLFLHSFVYRLTLQKKYWEKLFGFCHICCEFVAGVRFCFM